MITQDTNLFLILTEGFQNLFQVVLYVKGLIDLVSQDPILTLAGFVTLLIGIKSAVPKVGRWLRSIRTKG